MFMMDECVGHMTEKVIIPTADKIDVDYRKISNKKPDEYLPYEYGDNLVPDMVRAGEGYFFHVTGLTHDEKGYPVMDWITQEKCVSRLMDKIIKNADDIIMLKEENIDKAEVVVISFGITSRVALRAIQMAEESGIKNLGRLRLVLWFQR
jgi:2-oxoglutarate ferredoxin oxidoreductase subunit alpha